MHELCNFFGHQNTLSLIIFLVHISLKTYPLTVEQSKSKMVLFALMRNWKCQRINFLFVGIFTSVSGLSIFSDKNKYQVKFMQNMGSKIVKMLKIYGCSNATLRVNYGNVETHTLDQQQQQQQFLSY